MARLKSRMAMRPYRNTAFPSKAVSPKCGARQRQKPSNEISWPSLCLDEIGASDEACHKTRLGRFIECARMIDLLDAAMVHDGYPIGGHHGLCLVNASH